MQGLIVRINKIYESSGEIKKLMKPAIAQELDKFMARANRSLTIAIRQSISDILYNDFVVQDLISNYSALVHELGLTDPRDKMTKIIDTWANSTEVINGKTTYLGNKFYTNTIIHAIRSDYSDVLGLPEALQDRSMDFGRFNFRTKRNEPKFKPPLHWLEWLLFRGGQTIIQDYTLSLYPRVGRSGPPYIMVPNKKGWKLPRYAQGTLVNNFMTEAIRENSQVIELVMLKVLDGINI